MLVHELIWKLQLQNPNAEVVTSERGRYINTWLPVQAPKPGAMRKSPAEPYHYYESKPDEEGLTPTVEI